MQPDNQVTCWVVTDGRAGMENQCLGLATALNLQPVVKRIRLRTPWKQLSPYLQLGLSFAHSREGSAIAPPWPDILIASGRASVPASLYVRSVTKSMGAKRTITVHIQDPVIAPQHFDLVATPLHDSLSGENVIATRGALNRITPALLEREALLLREVIRERPRPYIGVLIGGPSRSHSMSTHDAVTIAAHLARLAQETGGTLLVTPSRRTGDENRTILKLALEKQNAFFWNMEGWNPYFGILGLADHFLVTADSTNLVSEACTTGKPVQIIDLPGGSPKFDLFHKILRTDGLTRPFTGSLETWSYAPLNDVQLVAEAVKKVMQARQS